MERTKHAGIVAHAADREPAFGSRRLSSGAQYAIKHNTLLQPGRVGLSIQAGTFYAKGNHVGMFLLFVQYICLKEVHTPLGPTYQYNNTMMNIYIYM